jgi:hypothetical protein
MKLIAGVLGALGLAATSDAGAQTTMVDPRTILFSMSTLANDAAPLEELGGRRATQTDVIFHEDEWRQIEFFPRSRLAEVQQTLTALKQFADEHRTASGWRSIYVRRLEPLPVVIEGSDRLLAQTLGASTGAAPILFTGANVPLGQIADGFSIPIGEGAALYGYADSTGVRVLGANVTSDAGNTALSQAFARLNESHDLVLVDWRAQLLLLSVEPTGRLVVWQP